LKPGIMETLLLTTLAATLFAGCASDPEWSWQTTPREEAAQQQAAAAPARNAPAVPAVQSAQAAQVAAVAAPAHDGPHALPLRPARSGTPRYEYGAKFEPPDGRILHGMGQWPEGNRNYLAVLGDPALEPASRTFFLGIGEWPRSWDSRTQALEKMINDEVEQGRMLHVSIALVGIDEATGRGERPIDAEIATSDRYDDHIRYVARSIRNAGVPTFVRIGFEFSGSWNGYTPFVYPKAYRHVVDIFREEKVENAAFVWCWEASCAGDFGEQGKDGWRWYPGDDYVDWFGLDLFNSSDFSGSTGRSGRVSRYGNTLEFLKMAEKHKRPVMIAESGAVLVGITPDEEDGRRDWAAWFEPFFKLLAEHESIKAFFYCNSDWKGNRTAQEQGWKDGDVSHNAYIAKLYALQMHDPAFLHKSELPLLRGWKPAPPREPQEKKPAPKKPRAAPAPSDG
jgi:hypothetical protein